MIWIVLKKNVAMFVIFTMVISALTGCIVKVERKLYGVKTGVYLEDIEMTGYFAKEVRGAVKNLAIERNQEARNAHFDKNNGEIIPGVDGSRVNVEKTLKKVLEAEKNTKIKLVIDKYPPRYGEEEMAKLTREIGSFVTGVGGTEERYHNVQLATKSINYLVLYPGEMFSFNKVVGPRTGERGFKDAPIMNEGGTFLGPGGGVCQVSSTLYNAAVQAKMKIVERHQHARPVGYVPPGMDATVDFAWLDLKFQNITDHPVLIRGMAENRTLRFWINGPGEAPQEKAPEDKQNQW